MGNVGTIALDCPLILFIIKNNKGAKIMRLDKYLKVSRIIKRRTIANEACDAGRVTVNGKIAKAGLEIAPGDTIEIRFVSNLTKVEVLSVQENVRKEDAVHLYKSL
jgi:ribosomal 50S subunit-recycling heat shock protein